MTNSLHPQTYRLIIEFSLALLEKLGQAEAKRGPDGALDWTKFENVEALQADLHRHLFKGDPRDVAAIAAFLWFHSASTRPTIPVEVNTDQIFEDWWKGIMPFELLGSSLTKQAAHDAWKLAIKFSACRILDLEATVRELRNRDPNHNPYTELVPEGAGIVVTPQAHRTPT